MARTYVETKKVPDVMRLSPFVDNNPYFKDSNTRLAGKIRNRMILDFDRSPEKAQKQKPMILEGQVLSPRAVYHETQRRAPAIYSKLKLAKHGTNAVSVSFNAPVSKLSTINVTPGLTFRTAVMEGEEDSLASIRKTNPMLI